MLIYSETFATFCWRKLFSYVFKWNTTQNIILMQRSAVPTSKALNHLSDMVLRSLFLINAILLNDRSPEQFDIIDINIWIAICWDLNIKIVPPTGAPEPRAPFRGITGILVNPALNLGWEQKT